MPDPLPVAPDPLPVAPEPIFGDGEPCGEAPAFLFAGVDVNLGAAEMRFGALLRATIFLASFNVILLASSRSFLACRLSKFFFSSAIRAGDVRGRYGCRSPGRRGSSPRFFLSSFIFSNFCFSRCSFFFIAFIFSFAICSPICRRPSLISLVTRTIFGDPFFSVRICDRSRSLSPSSSLSSSLSSSFSSASSTSWLNELV